MELLAIKPLTTQVGQVNGNHLLMILQSCHKLVATLQGCNNLVATTYKLKMHIRMHSHVHTKSKAKSVAIICMGLCTKQDTAGWTGAMSLLKEAIAAGYQTYDLLISKSTL